MKLKFGINYWYLAAAILLFAAMAYIAIFVPSGFIRWHFGDILVVAFIGCAARAVLRNPMRLLWLWVFLFATAVEIGQYFDLVGLLGLTGNPWAEIIIGTTFDIWDIVMYFIGCVIMVGLEMIFKKIKGRRGDRL